MSDLSTRTSQLLDAIAAVSSDLSLRVVLERLVASACELVDARYGALGVLDDDRLVEFITIGDPPGMRETIGHPPEGHGVLGLLIIDPRPIRLREISDHPASYGFPPGHPPMHSFLGVPIMARDQVFGNVYLCDKKTAPEFSSEDESLVVALAGAAGVAIENTRLHEQARELAVLSERERIARDLHDTVIQRLFATGMSLQATGRLVDDPAARRLADAVDELDNTIREIRTTIFALEHTSPDGITVRDRVLGVCHDMMPSLGFAPMIHFDGPVDSAIRPEVAEHLLAALREALANVAQHAHATRVDVVVRADVDATLRVLDDGRGPGETRTPLDRGRGLRNLAERATAMGGTCRLEPRPGGGSVTAWRVPLDPMPA